VALNIKIPDNISKVEVVAWAWNAIILPSIAYCDKYKDDVLENSGNITENIAFHGHGTLQQQE